MNKYVLHGALNHSYSWNIKGDVGKIDEKLSMKNARVRLSIKKKHKKQKKNRSYEDHRGTRKNVHVDDNGSDCSIGEKSTGLLFHNVAEGILLDSKRIKSILSGGC